jgi:molybdenum cofactor biosynthesis protein B
VSPGRACVITVSDRSASGERADESGPAAAEILAGAGFSVPDPIVISDDRSAIVRALQDAVAAGFDLVVTSGGTGLGPRDVTPEATAAVIERDVPGIPELMRFDGARRTPMAALSRARAGTSGTSLIVNLPGSPAGVRESLEILVPLLPHALEVVAGRDAH